MKIQELLEGAMKALWMKQNLGQDGSRLVPEPKEKPNLMYPRNVLSAAKKAKVDPSVADKFYEHAKKKFDPKLPNYWALVIAQMRRDLGIKESLEEGRFTKNVETGFGSLQYNWKSDLEIEEHEGYIPKGYSKKVLELAMIEVKEPGKGHGEQLMKMFLDTPEARNAELIFLDPVPGVGVNAAGHMKEEAQIKKLIKFYKRFGFAYNPSSATKRMWRVQKGHIPRNKLPT